MPFARHICGVALSALLVCTGCHTPRGDSVDRQIIGEVMMHSQFAANLRSIALPGGRLSGTPNAEQAAEHVAQQLRDYGLSNVHFEPFELQSWIVRGTRVTLLDDPPQVLCNSIALAKTQSTPAGGLEAELIDVGDGKAEDFLTRAAELLGRFALVRDNGQRRTEMMARACAQHAAGLVVMARPGQSPVIGNGHRTPRAEPGVVIPHDPVLLARLAAGEKLRMRVELQTENWTCHPRNVVAEIPGRGPHAREVVLLCAHLDSWHLGEGAIDNGNGSACILETARALRAIDGWHPDRTVRFVWFMAEELGLEGSRSYAETHAAEMDHIVAVINVDMPGSPRRFARFGHPEIEPFLKTVLADLTGYEISPDIAEASYDASDHAPFMYAGVCCLALFGELGPGVKAYHTADDLYDTVDRRGTIPSSAVLGVLARRLADAPVRPTERLPARPLPPF